MGGEEGRGGEGKGRGRKEKRERGMGKGKGKDHTGTSFSSLRALSCIMMFSAGQKLKVCDNIPGGYTPMNSRSASTSCFISPASCFLCPHFLQVDFFFGHAAQRLPN